MEILFGILIPFLGTTLGSACVFFMKKSLGVSVQRALAGFAAGVMVAASIWSLLIPAIEQAKNMGKLSFLPAFIGFWFGVLFLLMLDRLIPHLHIGSDQAEGPKSKLGRTTMMVLAVTLHNIPEGKAKRIRDNSKTIIHTSSSGKKGITVTLGKSPVWPFFCFCIKQGRTGGVTHRYGPFFISGNRAYLSVARNSDTSAVVMSKYITRFSASNSPVTLYRFFGS